MKIVCYGVRPIEELYFHRLNQDNYELKLVPDFMNDENVAEAQGMDAVLIRGNCAATADNLAKIASYGIKYVFTRTVGFNHIDLTAAKELGLQIARVPNYSPYAVAELAMTLGMQMFRSTSTVVANTAEGNFRVLPSYFSKEIHSSTVGIVGAGKIGIAEAKLYHGMGAKVLAYDPFPNDRFKDIVEFVSLEELLDQSDIVSVHVPYFPGKNENMFNAESFKLMKNSAIFVNTARGELVDHQAVIEAIKQGEIAGYAADVFVAEKDIMGKEFASINELPNPQVQALAALYPKVLLTPHVGSFTEPALEDMISISFKNFADSFATGTNANVIE
ncbi:NAD(P)-dependent oxidoreductase [Limosilactobacillus equigenerosi]|uniref:Lactate dehydrogenase n=1 Tax=Limosilactobacillus equigenerosi DSM 18793 = JCM 14505 TaxID=1423742 RepID=A0A0R1UVZ2_9LACO|nr:NAD(P)-dependent oxidoreductase [Limosilactobacillus equigenerosi]KRL95061.1 lactate dehydrogenase [Limosilactobacillus equigenerosi DSM 18793 = JCM 14505]